MRDKDNGEDIQTAVQMYFEWKERGYKFRWDSVLTRLLSMDLSKMPTPHLRHKLLSEFLEPTFLPQLDYWAFNKLHNQMSGDLHELYKTLDNLIPVVKNNSFHYNLLKFYRKHRPDFDTARLEARINELKI